MRCNWSCLGQHAWSSQKNTIRLSSGKKFLSALWRYNHVTGIVHYKLVCMCRWNSVVDSTSASQQQGAWFDDRLKLHSSRAYKCDTALLRNEVACELAGRSSSAFADIGLAVCLIYLVTGNFAAVLLKISIFNRK